MLEITWYSELDSTNAFALNQPDLPEGTVIASDFQSAGRGRLGRTWQSPRGLNLYFSLVLYPRLARHQWGGFSLAAGVAMAAGLAKLGLQPQLKWPNDLLICRRKLGGILLEAKDNRLVVGIGVNVNQDSFPPELAATSLKLETGLTWQREAVLTQLASEGFSWCGTWDQGDYEAVISAWREYDTVLGNAVSVVRGSQSIKGKAVDIGPGGELIVLDDDGNRQILHSGEVTLNKS